MWGWNLLGWLVGLVIVLGLGQVILQALFGEEGANVILGIFALIFVGVIFNWLLREAPTLAALIALSVIISVVDALSKMDPDRRIVRSVVGWVTGKSKRDAAEALRLEAERKQVERKAREDAERRVLQLLRSGVIMAAPLNARVTCGNGHVYRFGDLIRDGGSRRCPTCQTTIIRFDGPKLNDFQECTGEHRDSWWHSVQADSLGIAKPTHSLWYDIRRCRLCPLCHPISTEQRSQLAKDTAEKAEQLCQLRDYDGAIQVLEDALVLAPDEPSLHLTIGKVHYCAGRFEQAVQACDAALRLKRDWPDAQVLLCQALVANKKFARAVPILRGMIIREPDSPANHFLIGYALAQLGNRVEARQHFNRVLQLDTGDLAERAKEIIQKV